MTLDPVGAAWFVLDTSLRALAAALAVALVLGLLRVRAAAVLHSAWSAVLFAMLLMPVLPSIVPALPVPVPAPAGDFFDSASGTKEPSSSVVGHSTQPRTVINTDPTAQEQSSARLSDRLTPSDTGERPSRSWLPLVLLTVYVAGVLLFVGRLSYGWLVASAVVRRAMRRGRVLNEMADVVRRNRGRLTWQAVGVNGAGLLDSRIERLLRGDAFASASRLKKVGAWIGCVLAIATIIACRQQISATPLREDPELAKRLANQEDERKRFEAARDMTQEQADVLEQRIDANPEDFEARRQLVTYYRTSSKVAWDKKVPGLRRHALWLIEHHPEHDVQAPALSPQFDPEGFAAAKKLWDAHLARPDVSPFLVFRAASFFAPHDKPYAEQLIVRGMTMDPDSAALKARMPPDVGGYQWPVQLSSLYAAALRGSESAWGTYNDLRTHLDKVNAPYAKQVRDKLEATTDAQLLARVGGILTRPNQSTKDPALKQALDDVRALGVRYLERALELDPNLQIAKATLVNIRIPEQATEADRLANRALEGYMVAEDITEYAKKDTAAGKRQRDEATARAEEVLKVAAAHASDPAYSAAVMTAHHVLAIASLRDGDRERAVHHMRESVKVQTSDRIQYAPPVSWLRPVNRLLKEGERERVVEFLEAFARLTIRDRDRLLQDAKAIREGRMPSSYQHMVARER
jgi:hypothetical protein